MQEQLARVEHLPPVRVALLWKGEIRVVGHVRVREFLPRPPGGQVLVAASMPFTLGGAEPHPVVIRERSEIPAAVNATLGGTVGTEALDGVDGRRSAMSERFDGLANVLGHPAMAAREMRLLRDSSLAGVDPTA